MRLISGLVLLASSGCMTRAPHVSTDNIKSIQVIILRNKDFFKLEGELSVIIPKADWDKILAFVLPDKSTGSGENELKIGTATITYSDGETTSIELFFVGKNPCMVSLDGKHFFYARSMPDAPDGSMDLIRKVITIHESTSKMEKDEQRKREKERRKHE